jgi:hypothetical protein
VKLKWNDSERSAYILSRFQEGKNVKIVYNKQLPWYWICVPNRLHCAVASNPESPISNTPSKPGSV